MYLLIILIILSLIFGAAHFANEYLPKRFGPKKTSLQSFHYSSRELPSEAISISLTLFVLGIVWTSLWFYFLITGWSSFLLHPPMILVHVGLQIATASGYFAAAIAILKKWPKWQGIYMTNIFLLLSGTLMALILYGSHGHGGTNFMVGIGFVSLGICIHLTLALSTLSQALEGGSHLPAKEPTTDRQSPEPLG